MQDQGAAAPISILVLAAGASSRMRGGDKLLEPVKGQPLLRHVVRLALGTHLPVLVTLAQGHPARDAALDGLVVAAVRLDGAGHGMGASLRAGIEATPSDHALMVLLADMPDIDAKDLKVMIAAYKVSPDAIHRACTGDGLPGHPVIFPPWARGELLGVQGDTGAKSVLRAHANAVRLVVLPDTHATTDLDTPEDWARWRAR